MRKIFNPLCYYENKLFFISTIVVISLIIIITIVLVFKETKKK